MLQKRRVPGSRGILIAALAGCLAWPSVAQLAAGAGSNSWLAAPDIKVLFLGGPQDGPGCCHTPLPRYLRFKSEMAKVGIQADYAPGNPIPRDHIGLTDDSLKRYDVLVAYSTCSTEPAMGVITRFVESGKPVVALHVSLLNGGEKWSKLLGARYSDHGWGDPIRYTYINESHGAMAGVPREIPHKDETYTFWDLASDRIVLQKIEGGGDFTWIRKQGLGTVYYSGAGHQFPGETDGVWETWQFMKQLEVAIKWTHAQNPMLTTGVLPAVRGIRPDRLVFASVARGRIRLSGASTGPDAPGFLDLQGRMGTRLRTDGKGSIFP